MSFVFLSPFLSSFRLVARWGRPPVSLLSFCPTWPLHSAGLQLTSLRTDLSTARGGVLAPTHRQKVGFRRTPSYFVCELEQEARTVTGCSTLTLWILRKKKQLIPPPSRFRIYYKASSLFIIRVRNQRVFTEQHRFSHVKKTTANNPSPHRIFWTIILNLTSDSKHINPIRGLRQPDGFSTDFTSLQRSDEKMD